MASLLWSLNLSVDESLLTGESVPVRKVAVDRSRRRMRWIVPAAMTSLLSSPVPSSHRDRALRDVEATGRTHGTGQDRHSSPDGPAGANAAPTRDRSAGAPARHRRISTLRPGRPDLWPLPGRLADGFARRHCPGDVAVARRIPRGPDGLPGAGSLAHRAATRADSPHASHRDAGCCDCTVRR